MNCALGADVLPAGEAIVGHFLFAMVFAVVIHFFSCTYSLLPDRIVLLGLDCLRDSLIGIFGRRLDKGIC